MSGINKRLVIPTLLASIAVVSSLALTTSASANQEVVGDSWEILPISENRQEFQTETSPPNQEITTPAIIPSVSRPSVSQIPSTPKPSQSTEPQSPTVTPTVVPATTQATTPSPDPTPDLTPTLVHATLQIQGPGISFSHQVELKEGDTVYALLNKASKKFDFSLKVSQHSSLGVFVEGIAGTDNNPKINKYWLYYVNGQFASRGVSAQVVKEGDVIQWSYE